MKIYKFRKNLGNAFLALTMSLGANAMKESCPEAKGVYKDLQKQVEDVCQGSLQTQDGKIAQGATKAAYKDVGTAPQMPAVNLTPLAPVRPMPTRISRANKVGSSSSSSSLSLSSSSSSDTRPAELAYINRLETTYVEPVDPCQQGHNQRAPVSYQVNRAHIANYSAYVDDALMKPMRKIKITRHEDGRAWVQDVVLTNVKFGKHISHGSHRTKNWNNTTFTNVAFKAVTSHSVDLHNSAISNAYFNGSFTDWEFKNAKINRVWFNGKLKNVDFRGAYLKNVSFSGAKLASTKNILKHGKGVNFNGAILENVHFDGAAMSNVSFMGARFLLDDCADCQTYFDTANYSFSRQFVGAIFVQGDKTITLDLPTAQMLDQHFNTAHQQTSYTAQQIFQGMQQIRR